MKARLAAKVGCKCVRVLVYFVRIAWLVATACGECKLRNNIESLFGNRVSWQGLVDSRLPWRRSLVGLLAQKAPLAVITLGLVRVRCKVVCSWPLSAFTSQNLGIFIIDFECRLNAQFQLLLKLCLIKTLSDGSPFAFLGSHAHLECSWENRATLREILGLVQRKFLGLLGHINGAAQLGLDLSPGFCPRLV